MKFNVESKQNKEVIDLTDTINNLLTEKKIKNGTVLVFAQHTTAALTISEVGEGTDQDLLEVVQAMIPKIKFRHGHNPAHAPDHMIGSVLGPSLSLPIGDGKLDLGIWQRVVLIELNGPRILNLTLSSQ